MKLSTEPRTKLLKQRRSFVWTLTSFMLAALIAVPIVFILLSFFSADSHVWAHIRSTVLFDYTRNSLLLVLQVALYSLLIGVSCAWLVAATEFPGRRVLSWALILPLAAPAYIVAYVYTDLLAFSGPVQSSLRAAFGLQAGAYYFPQIRSLSGAAVVLALVLYPYVYLLSRVAFSQRSGTLFDAARTLGASPRSAFFSIALPAAWPAIIGGLALVMMETLADFGVVDYFGVPTFSTGIFRTWFALGDKIAAMKLAAVMFVFVLVLVALEKYQRNDQKTALMDRKQHRITLNRKQAVLAFVICASPVILGCLLPVSILAYYSVTTGDANFGADFFTYLVNSVSVASLASVLALCIALFLACSLLFSNNLLTRASVHISTLGYALPGIMLAIALLTPLTRVDHWLVDQLNAQGWQTGLIFSGSLAILLYAYVIRFLTVSYNAIDGGLSQIPATYTHVARSLGASPLRVISLIHLPLMRRSMLAALVLVFVDTMRELPATLVLRPFNFETLATRVYRLASDERLAEASTAALCIVLVGLIPVLFLNRLK